MKVLFVCRANVGRSQIAQALYSKITSFESASAGTKVEIENQKICERPLVKPVIDFMKKEGIDISQNTTNQIMPEMLDKFDKIIVMAEPETIPSFLLKNNKTILWAIEDLLGKNNKTYKKTISQIKTNIEKLIKDNKNYFTR